MATTLTNRIRRLLPKRDESLARLRTRQRRQIRARTRARRQRRRPRRNPRVLDTVHSPSGGGGDVVAHRRRRRGSALRPRKLRRHGQRHANVPRRGGSERDGGRRLQLILLRRRLLDDLVVGLDVSRRGVVVVVDNFDGVFRRERRHVASRHRCRSWADAARFADVLTRSRSFNR